MAEPVTPMVVAQGYLAGVRGAVRLPEPWTLADVAELAAQAGGTTVYIAEHSGGVSMPPVAGGWSFSESGTGWRWRLTRVDGQEVSIVSLPDDTAGVAGPWEGLGPRELLDAFSAFERLVGVPWMDGVGRTAERLILATHPRRRGGTTLDVNPSVPEPAADNTLELAYQGWSRPLLESEQAMGGQWVHAFDMNAQYLAAWGTVELGHGRPIHHAGSVFDGSMVGVWRVPELAALHERLAPGRPLPLPWLPGREWFTTPTYRRALEWLDSEGLDSEGPAPAEAWTWPAHSRFLRAASERIRDARAAAMIAAAERAPEDEAAVDAWLRRKVSGVAVLDAVKALYRVQTGRFGMAGRDARSPWARPDWGNMVRAQARVNLHRRLERLTAAPFAIATDGLLFVSDERDGRAFAGRIGLPLGDGLGQFQHDATAPREVVDQVLDAGGRGLVPALFRAVGDYQRRAA